jgi:hypothetical protein
MPPNGTNCARALTHTTEPKLRGRMRLGSWQSGQTVLVEKGHSRQGQTSSKSGRVRCAARSGSNFRALADPLTMVWVHALAEGNLVMA